MATQKTSAKSGLTFQIKLQDPPLCIFFRMRNLLSLCALILVTETLGYTRGGQSLGRGAGRMRGRGVASLGSRQRGAIRRFLAALKGDVDAGR